MVGESEGAENRRWRRRKLGAFRGERNGEAGASRERKWPVVVRGGEEKIEI